MSGLRLDLSGLDSGLQRMARIDAAMQMYCETQALNLESYAKENRPWTDRTNLARQTLKGSVEKKPFGFRISLSYGVDYGVWLELAHEKRYAIVEPTIRLKSQDVIKGMNNLFDRLVR